MIRFVRWLVKLALNLLVVVFAVLLAIVLVALAVGLLLWIGVA